MKNTLKQSFVYTFDPLTFTELGSKKTSFLDDFLAQERPYWLHFDRPSKGLMQQIAKKLNLSKQVRTILFSEEQRPRCIKVNNGYILIIQLIDIKNMQIEGDFPSLRFWITPDNLLSVCIGDGNTSALHELHHEISAMTDSTITPLTCLATFLEDIAWHLEETAYSLDENLDKIESNLHDIDAASNNIAEVRQSIASIRRYVIPERDAIISLSFKVNSIPNAPLSLFKEISDSMVRESETIDMLRERATIIQDTLSNQIGAIANKRMYLLTLVMLIFTPAFFVMGLFSMSVPIPGLHNSMTFWLVTLFIVVFTLGMLWVLKRKKWV